MRGILSCGIAAGLLLSCAASEPPPQRSPARDKGYDQAVDYFRTTHAFLSDVRGGASACRPVATREDCAVWGADLREGWDAFKREVEDESLPCGYNCQQARSDWRKRQKAQSLANLAAAYHEAFETGYSDERARYQKYGVLWGETIRRPRACLLLAEACGEVDGRLALLTAVREGREACAPLDAECANGSAADIEKRRTEYAAGFRDGYAELLEFYHSLGTDDAKALAEKGAAIPELPADCRAAPRGCGTAEGFASAVSAVDEGREACAQRDIYCERTRDERRETEEALVDHERALLEEDAAARAQGEREVLEPRRAEREQATREREAAVLAKAQSLLVELRSSEEACTWAFGELRLLRKENALAAWKALSREDQFALASAVERTGEAAGAMAVAVARAEQAIHDFVSRRCVGGI